MNIQPTLTPTSLPAAKSTGSHSPKVTESVPKVVPQADTGDKSVLSGAVRGGLTTVGVAALPGLAYMGAQSGGVAKVLSMYIVGTAVGAGAVAGALAGAASSQVSNNPFVGAGVGAGVGAAAGALALGIVSRSGGGAAAGALIGAVAGLVGGAAGTYATEKK